MFRAQQNDFDDAIAKATDENLTQENWEFMMDAWEKINESGENGPRDAAASLIKRLAHRNANVQLYTLELAHAFSQNCGPKMHRELASRAFTDALLRLAADRSTHAAVKTKILERMSEWTTMFKQDPDLGIMEQAYHKLKSQNPNIAPPSKPQKRTITEADRRKEEEELEIALAISLKEKNEKTGQAAGSRAAGKAKGPVKQEETPTPKPETAPHTTAATVSRVRALYDFTPTEAGELAFNKGDIIAVLESVYKDWWKGSLRGQVGIFPLNYVEKLSDPTPEELQKEAQMEAEVFAEIKNVEKLLALLSTSSPDATSQDSEEITRLYHSTLAIRPKLIELIGKYSQKKDDFVSLNEKFIKARRDYESLLESSMAAPPAGPYGRPPPVQTGYNYEGYPPPGGQPQRYFTPAPPVTSPHIAHNAYAPPAAHPDPPYPLTAHNTGTDSAPRVNRRTSNQFYAGIPEPGTPRPGPPSAADYYTTQPPPQNLGQQPGGPPENLNYPPQAQQQRPPAQYPHPSQAPQELATSVYDSPLNDRPPHGLGFSEPPLAPSMPPGTEVPPAQGRVSPQYGAASYYGGYGQQQPPRPASQGLPPQLSVGTQPQPHQNLQTPSQDVTPVSPPHPYPTMTPGPVGRTPASQYAPYAPPEQGGGSAPQDYYRNSELFLPQGGRA